MRTLRGDPNGNVVGVPVHTTSKCSAACTAPPRYSRISPIESGKPPYRQRPRTLWALHNLINFLSTKAGLTRDDACALSSITVSFGITQVVDVNIGR